MIWKTKTHEFTATICMRTGKPCPMAARTLKSLTHAASEAMRGSGEAFEMEGAIELTGCAPGCTARFGISSSLVRLFCDVDAEAELASLNRLADALMKDGNTLPSSNIDARPVAMLQSENRVAVSDRRSETPTATRFDII
ncbi:MAG: hypothetical protein ACU0BB_01870 [Paracoccaceae bacterium]